MSLTVIEVTLSFTVGFYQLQIIKYFFFLTNVIMVGFSNNNGIGSIVDIAYYNENKYYSGLNPLYFIFNFSKISELFFVYSGLSPA